MSDPDELSTLHRPRFDPTPASQSSFVVEVIEGADTGASLRIDGDVPSPVLLGTGPACELRLTDREVSRRHLSLEPLGARLRVRDLGSKNGSHLDGIAIVEAFACGGETLRVGGTALRLTRHDGSPSKSAPVATSFGRLLGASTEMRRLYPLCERLAASSVPVVIEGETGTGKEQLTEALHEQGPRASEPFVVFDCTAVAPSLIEAELFGHERGAFTGAVATRKGVFEQADGGTLFIDEIGDLDLAMQPKLLRAIERGEIRRVGGTTPIKVDVRIICATRRDLDREVQSGRFRDDLFHRLAVARIELPPLRKRAGDVALLAAHFAKEMGAEGYAFSPDTMLKWQDSAWPGNVRELRNAVARTIAIGELSRAPAAAPRDETLEPIESVLALDLPLIAARERIVEIFEERYIDRLVAKHGNNVARAAAASGVALRHFQRLRAKTRKP